MRPQDHGLEARATSLSWFTVLPKEGAAAVFLWDRRSEQEADGVEADAALRIFGVAAVSRV